VSDGFAAMAARVSGLHQQATSMKAAVDAGHVRIEPDAAANTAKACRAQMARLDERLYEARRLTIRVNFGDCDEGNQLSGKFSQKAQGGPNSAYELIVQAQQALENLAKTYEAAGRMYQQTDEGNAQAFKGKM
jgi:hypothetical protein